ncbi:MAG: fibronectin-binding autotransporter adhesin [Verrucomicrobiota bacterium]|jgi:autotransporter-associated beta strand protein
MNGECKEVPLNQQIPADKNCKVKNRRGGVSLHFQLLPALAAVLLTALLWLIASRQSVYDGPTSSEPAITQTEHRTPAADPVPAAEIYQGVRHDAGTVAPDLVPESQAAAKTFHLRLGWVGVAGLDGNLQFGLIDSDGLALGPTPARSGSTSGSVGTIGSGGSFQIAPVSGGGIQPAATLTANPATWNGGDYVNSHNWTDTGNWSGVNANPDGGGTTIVHFSGGTGPNPFNDYGAYTQFNQILFDSGATISFTLSGAAIKLAPNGGSVAKIENNSALLQTVSFNTSGQSIGFVGTSGTLELDPTNGDLTINNDIFVDNSASGVIHVFGSHILTLNGSLGNGAVTAALTIESTATVVLAANNSYSGETVVKGGGTVQFATAGSSTGRANNSTFRLGDGVANADSAAAITLNLATTAGGQSIDSVINPRLGTTGLESLNSQNTSGTNSLTNHIGLDHDFTITQAAGTGALNITQAKGVDNSTGYDIKGFTATFTPGAGGTINDSGTIYSSTGGGNVLMNGAGTLTLSGTNTYSGGTTLSSGTLNINSTTALGATAAAFTINGGTIDNTTAGAITLANNNPITLGANFAFTGTKDLNLGTGAITNAGNRTITLNGVGSTLTLGGLMTNSSATTQTTTVNGAGNTLVLGSYALANSSTSRTGILNGSGNVSITGVVSNGSTATLSKLTYAGTGTLTLSGASTFGGGFTLNNGTVAIGADSTGAITNGPLGTGTLTLTASPISNTIAVQAVGGSHTVNNAVAITTDVTINGSQNLTLGGTWTQTNSNQITNNIGAGKLFTLGAFNLSSSATGRTLTIAGTGDTTFGGIISNGSGTSGAFTDLNTGTVLLTAANSYSAGAGTTIGSTAANAGILRLSGVGTLGATSNALTIRGGTLDLNGTTQTISTLLLGGGVAATSANITLGGGTLNLGGTVTYSQTNNPNGATISGAGALSLNGTRTFSIGDSTTTAAELTISSIIQDGSGSSGISKQSAGTLVLSGANTYTGKTTITAGTLSINTIQNAGSATPNALGEPASGANSIIDLAGTLQYTGSTAGSSDRVINLTGATGGAGSLDASGSTTFALSGGVTSAGTSGTTTLTLTGTGSGSESGVIANGTSPNVTAVTKTGAGTWTLSGMNTYTGATTIASNGGTLIAGATGALGNTASVTVNSGGILALSGSGNLDRVNNAAPITLGTTAGAAGTILRSGNGTVSEGVGASRNGGTVTGTSSVGFGALTLASTSNLDFGTGGVGTLNFTSFAPTGFTLNILNYTSTANQPANISGVDGTDDRLIFNQDQSGNLGSFNFGGIAATEIALDTGFFEVVPIPEPSTWVVGALAFSLLLVTQRRRMTRLLKRAA